ncbi:MAG: hypothetical protein ACI9JL_003397 [Paracoccaceae bacterium]|jgi:hypothetical protein
MPRSVDPKWGVDRAVKVKFFQLQNEDLNAIFDSFPKSLSEDEAITICSEVETIGTHYRKWQRSGRCLIKRVEARKALEQLDAREKISAGLLNALNARAISELFDELCKSRELAPSGEPAVRLLFTQEPDCDVLRSAIRSCITRLKSTKGPDRNDDLSWAVGKLCALFEDITKTRVTLSNKGELLEYRSGPSGNGAKFLEACMQSIDPGVKEHTLSTAIRQHIEHRS